MNRMIWVCVYLLVTVSFRQNTIDFYLVKIFELTLEKQLKGNAFFQREMMFFRNHASFQNMPSWVMGIQVCSKEGP